MNLRKATVDDVDLLIKIRLDSLKAERGSLAPNEEQAICQQLQEYFPRHITDGQCVAMIAEIDGELACAACLVIMERPASPSFITGKTGTLMSLYTYPQYRRKGLATKVVELLIEKARQAGLPLVELFATKEGKPLYEKMGFFIPAFTPMRMRL